MSLKSGGECQVRSGPAYDIMSRPQLGNHDTPMSCRMSTVTGLLVNLTVKARLPNYQLPRKSAPGVSLRSKDHGSTRVLPRTQGFFVCVAGLPA